jgi:hypothetical protein
VSFYRRLAVTVERQCYRSLGELLRRHSEKISEDNPLAPVSLQDLSPKSNAHENILSQIAVDQ